MILKIISLQFLSEKKKKGRELKQRKKPMFSNISNCYIIVRDWVYKCKEWRNEAIFHLLQVGRNICLNCHDLSQENGLIFLYFHVDLAWKSLHIQDTFLISLHRSLTILYCCMHHCIYKTCVSIDYHCTHCRQFWI